MKSLMKRGLLLLLALTMLLGCLALASCETDDGSNPDENGTGTGGGNAPVTLEPLTGEARDYLPTEKKYKNYEFVMHAPKQNEYGTGHYVHLEGSEDIIDLALRHREILMQDMFGVILTLNTDLNANGMYTSLQSNHRAQKHFADVLFTEASDSMQAASQGMVWNLNLLEELNLEASYYDQRIQQNFRIGDMLFQLTGDYEVLDELVTFGVLYNDFVYKNLGYYDSEGTPYQMVKEYRWTYAKMMELASEFTSITGAEHPQDEQWGIVSEQQAVYYFYMGSGLQPMQSVNGELEILLSDKTNFDLTLNAVETLMGFSVSDDMLFSSDIVIVDSRTKSQIASDIFEENRALFRTTSLSDALYCSEMEKDFGILPVPLLAEGQTAYYNQINADAAWPMCIPFYVNDVHRVADIFERLSYYSRYGSDTTLYEEFFQRLADARICRKSDDRLMMELVFSTKVYCIDTYLPGGSTGLRSIVISMASAKKGPVDLGSKLTGAVSTAEKTLHKYVDLYDLKNSTQEDRYNGN